MQTHVTIKLLRHGETTAGPCFLGSTDAPLSELGWQQMQSAVKHKTYTSIISSPLKRCAEFAQQLANKSKLPLSFESKLREISFGDWEAKTTEQLWKAEQTELKAFWADPINNTPPNAEKLQAFQARVNHAFDAILKTHPNGSILLIVHGGVIRQIVSHVLSLPYVKAQKINFDYAGLTQVECYDGNLSLSYINQRVYKINNE